MRTTKNDDLVFEQQRVYLRSCKEKDFEVRGQLIVDKIDQSSAKYALCCDLANKVPVSKDPV